MNRDEIRGVILRSIESVAPEVDAFSIDPKVDFRDALDIDSMDFLHIITAIHDALGVDIPEADYARLATIDQSIAYLSDRVAPPVQA